MAFDSNYTQFKKEFAANRIFPFSKRFRRGSVPLMYLRPRSIAGPYRGTTAISDINSRQRVSVPSLDVSMQPIDAATRRWNYNTRRASIVTPVVFENAPRKKLPAMIPAPKVRSCDHLTNQSNSSPSRNLKIFRINATNGLSEVILIQNTATSRQSLHDRRSSIPLNDCKYFEEYLSHSSHYYDSKGSLSKTTNVRGINSQDISGRKVGSNSQVHEESLSKLRARADLAREHLRNHQILLDRYLLVNLSPETDVMHEVETRYGELLLRNQSLQRCLLQGRRLVVFFARLEEILIILTFHNKKQFRLLIYIEELPQATKDC